MELFHFCYSQSKFLFLDLAHLLNFNLPSECIRLGFIRFRVHEKNGSTASDEFWSFTGIMCRDSLLNIRRIPSIEWIIRTTGHVDVVSHTIKIWTKFSSTIHCDYKNWLYKILSYHFWLPEPSDHSSELTRKLWSRTLIKERSLKQS